MDEGFGVRHPVPRFQEGVFQASECDLEVWNGRLWLGLEVKGKGVQFMGADDYPFGSVYLGAPERWEIRVADPWFVIVWSEPTAGRLTIPCHTRKQWATVLGPLGVPSVAAPRECFRSWESFLISLGEA
jgi:hypothetical protein